MISSTALPQPNRRSRAATLLLAGLAAVAVGACGRQGQNGAPPPPEVNVAKVLSRPVREWNEFTGRISAVESVELRPRVSGYVERVAYKEGQEVKKGDLLFVIDERRYRAQLNSALADLERARSAAALAKTQNARGQKMLADNAVSREEADTRAATATQTVANVQAAEAAVANAKLDLQFTQVRSPVSGRAGRAAVTVGNLAQSDTTVLTSVVSQDPVYVYFDCDEQAYLRFAALARKGERDSNRNPVRVGLADEQGYPHEGKVDFTDNQVNPSTGTIRARAVLANPDRQFTPGLFARVQLEGAREAPALLIDDKAVLTDQNRKYVYVLGPENKALRKDVELGRMVEGLRVVNAGLTAQDRVVVEGVQKVFMPGMPVKPQMVEMGVAPGAASAPQAAAKVAAN
jgi:multidrug efflux system membrane fusion protein